MTFEEDRDDVITVVERYTKVASRGWRPGQRFGGKHGRLVGVAILVVTVSWFGLIVWTAKAGTDAFKKSLGDIGEF